jgi:hypothetical protein
MAAPAFPLVLDPDQRATLTAARDHHPKPYVRERASALLKVASGLAICCAAAGSLRPRRPETVGAWVHGYLRRGISALLVAKGRGRKPAFSPDAPHP